MPAVAPPETDVKVIDRLPIEDYHRETSSISSSGLRALLDPGCPAQFKHDRDNPRPPKPEFDLGNAVHAAVLGEGHDIVVLDYADWKKPEAREKRDAAHAAGKVPLLPKEKAQVDAMAAAVRQHAHAGPLFAPGNGIPERSIYWTHPDTGVRLRVRPDWLIVRPGVTAVVDLKTTTDASPDACSKAIESYGYHQQGALYIDGVRAAGLAPADVRFIFVFVSKRAPHLITVRALGEADELLGRDKNERALRTYADCMRSGEWPDWTGPVTEIPTISLPPWAASRETEEYIR